MCGLESKNKHAAALHSVFAQSGSNDLGAANVRHAEVSHSSDTEGYETSDNNEPPTVRKLRTCAVRVFNLDTNKCTLAYAQHDTASQVTLIFEQLKNELGLNVNTNLKVRIRTLSKPRKVVVALVLNYNLLPLIKFLLLIMHLLFLILKKMKKSFLMQ